MMRAFKDPPSHPVHDLLDLRCGRLLLVVLATSVPILAMTLEGSCQLIRILERFPTRNQIGGAC